MPGAVQAVAGAGAIAGGVGGGGGAVAAAEVAAIAVAVSSRSSDSHTSSRSSSSSSRSGSSRLHRRSRGSGGSVTECGCAYRHRGRLMCRSFVCSLAPAHKCVRSLPVATMCFGSCDLAGNSECPRQPDGETQEVMEASTMSKPSKGRTSQNRKMKALTTMTTPAQHGQYI